MKQLLVKLSEEDYRTLEEYCKKTGRTKSAVVRREISKLKKETSDSLLRRKVKRISTGKGKLLSEIIREMRV
jgi:predicted DNA-binding protein